MVDKIPDYLRESLLAFANTTMKRKPDFVLGGYLHRWHLGPYGNSANAYIHQFVGDDEDHALHDHPYDNVSVVLTQGYIEHFHAMPLKVVGGKYETVQQHRRSGDVIEREAMVPHRISLIQNRPAVSLFLCGPRVREWGFILPTGWVHYKDFEAGIK